MVFDQYANDVKLTNDQRKASQESWGGFPVYIPKITKEERENRNLEISKLYWDCKLKLWQIAKSSGLSLKQVRRIVFEKK